MGNDKKKPTKEEILSKYRKEHGQGSIGYLSDDIVPDIKTTSTGSISIDLLLGNDKKFMGFPRGRVIELFGPEASMKTTISIAALAEIQKEYPDRDTVFIDAEQAFNRDIAAKMGIDFNKLIIVQENITENALNLIIDLVSTGEISAICIDSVAALVPLAEFEGEVGESKMGVQARLMSQLFRKITALANQNDTTLIFINQLRKKIGITFGSPDTTTGGEALKYYSSVRLKCSSGALSGANKELGRRLYVKMEKNKLVATAIGKTAELDYFFDAGFDRNRELVELATNHGVIKKSGSWFSHGETKLGQGANAVKEFFDDNPEFAEEIYKELANNL